MLHLLPDGLFVSSLLLRFIQPDFPDILLKERERERENGVVKGEPGRTCDLMTCVWSGHDVRGLLGIKYRDSLTYSLTHLLAHSLTHLLTHLLTHSLTPPLLSCLLLLLNDQLVLSL